MYAPLLVTYTFSATAGFRKGKKNGNMCYVKEQREELRGNERGKYNTSCTFYGARHLKVLRISVHKGRNQVSMRSKNLLPSGTQAVPEFEAKYAISRSHGLAMFSPQN